MNGRFAHRGAAAPVDGARHVMRKYGRGRRQQGLYAGNTARVAFSGAGDAHPIPSIVLTTGLSAPAVSTAALTADTDSAAIVTPGLALQSDFPFLLPPLFRIAEDIVMHPRVELLFSAFVLAVSLSPAFAESPEEKGLAIALEADRRDSGFGDSSADLLMVLRNRHGEESIRDMRSKSLEVEGDGDKSLTIFDRPEDVKGTALLTYTHKTGDDDQWLYLPALKRVKRIASNNKSGPFMGSEFAYEDIASQEVEKYTYKFLRREMLDGEEVFVLERYPVDRKSGYTRQVVWMDTAEYRLRKVDYYDRKNSLLKTLTFDGYRQYLGKFWRADDMFMVNHQTGKSTRLSWKNYRFRSGLTDRDFDRNALKRAR